jgi:predicted DsbA family dithiol-disulfide isomerase
VLCPWCYVAAIRIDAVQQAVGDALEVEWRAFMLRPRAEDRSLDRFRHYVQSWRRPAEAEPDAAFAYWDGDAAPPSHSLPPLVATKVAASFGDDAFHRFHLALMRAYFADNRTVSDRAVVLDVAGSTGLDAGEFATRLDRDGLRYEHEVVADHKDALAQGIAAVPAVLVDHEHVLTGALPIAAYRRVVARRT